MLSCSLADKCRYFFSFRILMTNKKSWSKSARKKQNQLLFPEITDIIHQLYPLHVQSIRKYTRR